VSVRSVCIFTETFHPVVGGGETQARLLAEGLASRGISVCILTRRSDPTLPRAERYGDVKVFRLPPAGPGQLKKWGLIPFCLPTLIRLRRDYELLFVSGFRIIGVSSVIAGKFLGRSVVLKADSQGEMSGEFFREGLKRFGLSASNLVFRFFLGARNAILRRADAFSAITDGVAEELASAGVQPHVVHRVPNCVDTGRFFPVDEREKRSIRNKLGIPPQSKVVIYTGRLVSYKGLPLLLRAWPALRSKYPEARLLLVGTGGLDIHNCEDDLKGFVEDHDLADTVTFTGSVENVPEYLQASDIFAFPTENDAFPSSLIEAMSCRLPVVATPVGAIGNILQDGQNGLMVTPGDLDGLRQALDRLLLDDSLALRLGETGWRTVRDRYSADIVVREYVKLFDELARRTR
jgi:glycosyltransferase involved in cell wall biosynthesis